MTESKTTHKMEIVTVYCSDPSCPELILLIEQPDGLVYHSRSCALGSHVELEEAD